MQKNGQEESYSEMRGLKRIWGQTHPGPWSYSPGEDGSSGEDRLLVAWAGLFAQLVELGTRWVKSLAHVLSSLVGS